MSRVDDRTLRRAHLLSALARTPDDQLGAFAQRAGLETPIDAGSARLARDLLDAVCAALEGADWITWERIETAVRVLTSETGERAAYNVPAQHAGTPTPDLDATVGLVAPAETQGKVLPFEGSSSPPASAVRDAAPHPGIGETAFIPTLPDVEATTPFTVAAEPPMSLERYAALLVDEERAHVSERAAVYQHHGIDAEERRRVDQEMGRHLRRDPGARAKLDELVASYRAARR